jgi:gliding motility-associated-like protein
MRFLYILLFFTSFFTFSQFSKTHYIPPIVGVNGQPVQAQYLYISCPNPDPVAFTIQIFGGETVNGTVSRDQPFEYQIGAGENSPMHISDFFVNQVLTNKGCIVEAEDQIYVALRLTATTQNFQASGLVSKGLAAPGKQFRIGGFVNDLIPNLRDIDLTFVTILALENSTTVSFDDIKPGAELLNDIGSGNEPQPIILNRGESFSMAIKGPSLGNRNALIGALIQSDKDIVVNCGSFGGTNSSAQNNVDIGFDQIVGHERIGTEYIFIRAQGTEEMERPLIVAHEDNTEVYLNGAATANFILNAGEFTTFAQLNGLNFGVNGNLYVNTSKPVYAYQGFGGTNQPQNQEMHFVPPLSCQTPRIIDNIPLIDNIGDLVFTDGFANIVTETGASLEFRINGALYNPTTLPAGVTINGPFNVDGNANYVTYTLSGLSGNVAVFSSGQVYLSYYGSSGAATYGGFYSGFTFKPEITFNAQSSGVEGCIPNVNLSVSTLSPFDTYQWYLNGSAISGATNPSYQPNLPGYYYLSATIAACNVTLVSDEIPVSICTPDTDNDAMNDNIDIDYDNDGILNCTESYGNYDFDLSNNTENISVGSYNNSLQVDLLNTNGYIGDINSNIYLATLAGENLTAKTRINFNTPINIQVEYITATSQANHLMNAHTDYIIRVPINQTITLINPTGQLLVDTNYDGIYENNVNFYSSFEIRFRLSSNTSLAIGTGDFYFKSYRSSFIEIEVKNTSETLLSQNVFKVFGYCLPKDSDGDGVFDDYDLDSDNDGIPDNIEANGLNVISPSGQFSEFGVDLAFNNGNGVTPIDSDSDDVLDYLDLDSDNDGIFDLNEANHNAIDANNDGVIDGSVGANGMNQQVQNGPNSGQINFTIWDIDGDGIPNYIDLDSDGDNCNDVIEAGFSDNDNNGLIGTSPLTVNINGIPNVGQGYSIPPFTNDYITTAPLSISSQPIDNSGCQRGDVQLTMSSPEAETYQWQISTDGGLNWVNLVENMTYFGTITNTLNIINIVPSMNGHQFRVFLNRNGNTCGLFSAVSTLTVYGLPVLVDNLTLLQCESQITTLSIVNLKQKEPQISTNHVNETFQYYSGSYQNAFDANSAFLIPNPEAYLTSNTTVWVRVTNQNDCFDVVAMQVVISSSAIFPIVTPIAPQCEDLDEPGVANFDLTPALTYLETLLPNPITDYQILFYKTEQDALLQTDAQGNSLAITDITNYRNTGFPYTQEIWVRFENVINNDCFAIGPYVTITVLGRPRLGDDIVNVKCEENQTIILNPTLLSGTPNQFTYQWYNGNSIITGATNYIYNAPSGGSYSVEVTDISGCSAIQNFTITISNKAIIQSIEIIDLSSNNTVSIFATGLGNYEYSLDGINYQQSPIFENVLPNIYTVYVRDINGCGIVERKISVLGVPLFFTPNGDGYNDQWNLQGARQTDYPAAKINIFDRTGKIVATFNPFRGGWNGTYNNLPLPSTDYWYVLDLGTGRIAKGHFALKR